MDNRTNSKRVAKNTVFLFLRMLVVICVGLYTSRIVLNTLGVQDFGIYNVVGGIVVLFSFLQSALTNATYRFLAYDMGEWEYVFFRAYVFYECECSLDIGVAYFLFCVKRLVCGFLTTSYHFQKED